MNSCRFSLRVCAQSSGWFLAQQWCQVRVSSCWGSLKSNQKVADHPATFVPLSRQWTTCLPRSVVIAAHRGKHLDEINGYFSSSVACLPALWKEASRGIASRWAPACWLHILRLKNVVSSGTGPVKFWTIAVFIFCVLPFNLINND